MKNILIVGKANSAVEVLCRRLLKEGKRIYLLTAVTDDLSVRGVKKYVYPYDSDSIYEIFGSCRPDVVIFMGAYDTLFTWGTRTDSRSYQRYVSGVANVLRIAEVMGVQRFLYLSDGSVFEEDYLEEIHEDVKPSPRSVKAKAIAMGETMVSYYNDTLSLDGIILRFDHLFFCPRNTEECIGLYAETCRRAVVDGAITVDSKAVRTGLWMHDAAEAIFRLANAPAHSRQIYHITGNETITDEEMARFIQAHCSRAVQVTDRTEDTQQEYRLKDRYFAQEFGFSVHYSLRSCLEELLAYMQKNITHFQRAGSGVDLKKGLGKVFKAVFPFLEALICFALIMLLQIFYGDSALFEKLDLFLLYILLFSLVYGLRLAVFTDVLSMIGYLLLASQGDSPLRMFIDVATYVWIAQIFIVGMSVGYQRDTLRNLRADKDEEIGYLHGRLEDITEINDSTTTIKDYFESQVINNQDGLSVLYEIITTLDNAADNGLLFEVANVLKNTMGTDSVAIYRSSGQGYYHLLTSTTAEAYELGRSLKISDFSDIFEILERDSIYVNTSADQTRPSMVSCIKNEEGNVQMALFLWKLPFERMTLQNRNRFRILSLVIRGALLRAGKYQEALIHQRYLPGTQVLNREAFLEVERVYRNAASRSLVEYLLLRAVAEPQIDAAPHGLMSQQFRETDVIGYFGDGIYYVIAVNCGPEHQNILLNRLGRRGFSAAVVSGIAPEELAAAPGQALPAAETQGQTERTEAAQHGKGI